LAAQPEHETISVRRISIPPSRYARLRRAYPKLGAAPEACQFFLGGGAVRESRWSDRSASLSIEPRLDIVERDRRSDRLLKFFSPGPEALATTHRFTGRRFSKRYRESAHCR
jgi:hypothetical protein